MREMRFRGKTKYGVWVYGGFVKLNETAYIVKVERQTFEPYLEIATMEEVDPDTVGQYTGLKDRNGREIYEGDIVSTDLSRPFNIVVFRNGAFIYQCHDNGEDYFDYIVPTDWENDRLDYGEVIGNIHDNPELLKGEETA